MNLLNLQTALKRYGFDDSDPLDQWINASYQEMGEAVDWTFLEVMTTVPTILGSNTIAFPADFRKIISLRDSFNQYKLKWVSRRRFEDLVDDPTERGTPNLYALIGLNSIQLWPVPDNAYDLNLIYQKQYDDLVAGTDVPVFPTAMHYTIIYGAARIALQAENEEERSQTAAAMFDAAMARHSSAYAMRQLDDSGQVVDTQGYFDQ